MTQLLTTQDDIAAVFHSVLKEYHHENDIQCSLCSCKCTASTLDEDILQTSTFIGTDSSTTDGFVNPFPSLHPSSVAYWLHTTGTTGEPKLVQVPHCCIVPNIVDLRRRFAISPDDVVFNAAPLTFDPSAVEVCFLFQVSLARELNPP